MFRKNQSSSLLIIATVVLVLIFYKTWIFNADIIGGDWPYYYPEMLKDFTFPTPLWISQEGIGLGGVSPAYAFLSYQHLIVSVFVNTLHISWNIVYKVFWFGTFLVLSMYSSRVLFRRLFFQSESWQQAICILVYTTNTYILMIASGGQIGIALAYSLAPVVLAAFVNLSNSFSPKDKNFRSSIFTGLIVSLQILFDIRIAYVTIIASLFFVLLHLLYTQKQDAKHILFSFFTISVVTIGLHAFWIAPFFIFHLLSIPEGVIMMQGFKFFSFSDFSHAFSLLHPNWPENIFGKTYFLKSEFIIFPVLAYISLVFLKNLRSKIQNENSIYYKFNILIFFFVILGLLGTFLAKGVNPPFGEINDFLFRFIPGMNLFRDPTKFYILIGLSYSVLIPVGIYNIYSWFQSRLKHKTQIFFVFAFFVYWLFLLKPVLLEQTGTFKSVVVPKEYIDLKKLIISQPNFFRTLWIPNQTRFRIQTENHPLINARSLLRTTDDKKILQKLRNPETLLLLQRLSVKYLIIPYDITSEVFLTDRKYNYKKREYFEKELDSSGFKKIQGGRIVIYEIPNYKDHFFLEGKGLLSYQRKESGRYNLAVDSVEKSSFVFVEQFHPYWKALVDGVVINGRQTKENLICFEVPKGKHTIEVFFEPQKTLKYAYAFSFLFFLTLIVILIKTENDINIHEEHTSEK